MLKPGPLFATGALAVQVQEGLREPAETGACGRRARAPLSRSWNRRVALRQQGGAHGGPEPRLGPFLTGSLVLRVSERVAQTEGVVWFPHPSRSIESLIVSYINRQLRTANKAARTFPSLRPFCVVRERGRTATVTPWRWCTLKVRGPGAACASPVPDGPSESGARLGDRGAEVSASAPRESSA